MAKVSIYHGFLGDWVLVPESCDFEQSEPPQSGLYRIEELAEGLRFEMIWTDSAGTEQRISFCGVPDGKPRPFAGGELADALSISAPSERELKSTASYRGEKRMVAQWQLDDTGQALRLVQMVLLPDGSTPRNISVYRRHGQN